MSPLPGDDELSGRPSVDERVTVRPLQVTEVREARPVTKDLSHHEVTS